MARGKSLKIFMMDGDAAGRWVCTLAGRTTKAWNYWKDSTGQIINDSLRKKS